MRYTFLILLFSFINHAQNTIQAKLFKSLDFPSDYIVAVDNFGTTYYTTNNTFYKKTKDNTLSYNNLQLGDLFSINTFNPLKINLFYRDFNTVIILDNRLAEVHKMDFNSIQPYKNITHISSGFDNTLWVFNQDTQQLELYNYKNNTTKARSLPIQSNVLDLKSNYNSAWLLTEDYIYQYNYFGNLLLKIKNNGFTKLTQSNNDIILKKENDLYFLGENSKTTIFIELPKFLINQFFVVNETLYIYHHQTLEQFQLKTN